MWTKIKIQKKNYVCVSEHTMIPDTSKHWIFYELCVCTLIIVIQFQCNTLSMSNCETIIIINNKLDDLIRSKYLHHDDKYLENVSFIACNWLTTWRLISQLSTKRQINWHVRINCNCKKKTLEKDSEENEYGVTVKLLSSVRIY